MNDSMLSNWLGTFYGKSPEPPTRIENSIIATLKKKLYKNQYMILTQNYKKNPPKTKIDVKQFFQNPAPTLKKKRIKKE